MSSAPAAGDSKHLDRPAFYALGSGGWRDLVTLLHPPYTAWHLSYVALGAAAAPQIHLDRLLAALGAFFLAVGVAAHALDELNGRPLKTQLSDRALIALASIALAGAIGIGIAGLFTVSGSLAIFDGTSVPLSAEVLASPLDGALRALSWAVVMLAAGLVALRL
jgi:hypothetical protein